MIGGGIEVGLVVLYEGCWCCEIGTLRAGHGMRVLQILGKVKGDSCWAGCMAWHGGAWLRKCESRELG